MIPKQIQRLKPKKLLITGCAKSGTAYTSKLLQICDIDAPHEEKMGEDGIVSWALASKLDDIIGYERTLINEKGKQQVNTKEGPKWSSYNFTPILHQVRYPLDVIQPKLFNTFTTDSSREVVRKAIGLDYNDYVGKELLYFMKYYYHWNLLCEGISDWTYKIESLEYEIPKFCRMIGREDKIERMKFKIHSIPKNIGTRKQRREGLNSISTIKPGQYEITTWDWLFSEDKKLAMNIKKMSERYGYTKAEIETNNKWRESFLQKQRERNDK